MKKHLLVLPLSLVLLQACSKPPPKPDAALKDRGESEVFFDKNRGKNLEGLDTKLLDLPSEKNDEVKELGGDGEKPKKPAASSSEGKSESSQSSFKGSDEEMAIATAAQSFLSALKKGDMAAVSDLIPKKDREKSEENLQKTAQAFQHPFFKSILSKTTSKVTSVSQKGNTAKVEMEISALAQKDIEKFMTEQMTILGQDAKFQQLGQMEKLAVLGKSLDTAKLPLEKNKATAELVKENGEWLVSKPPQSEAPKATKKP